MENKDKPLVDKLYQLQKYPGKGGWTYAIIPEIAKNQRAHFGWVRVKGFIDDFELKNYRLMPLGNGQMFLPVRAEIRKKIGKAAGDDVHVILFPDNEPLEIPDELLACLRDEPSAHNRFLQFSESEQKEYIDWIYGSKKKETQVARIVKAIDSINKGKRLSELKEDQF